MKKSIDGYISSKLLRVNRESFKEEKEDLRSMSRDKSLQSLESLRQSKPSVPSLPSKIPSEDNLKSLLHSALTQIKKKARISSESCEVKDSCESQLKFLFSLSQRFSKENEEMEQRLDSMQDYLCLQYESDIQKLEAEVREHIKVYFLIQIQQQLKLYVETLTSREEEIEKTSVSSSLASLESEKKRLQEQIAFTKSRLKTKSTATENEAKTRVSIDSILKTLNDSMTKKGNDKSLLAKYMQAKKDLSCLNKENHKPFEKTVSRPTTAFPSGNPMNQKAVESQKRANRSISMAAYPLQSKLRAEPAHEKVMPSKPSNFQSYLETQAKRVLRSHSIGEYLQKKLEEPWEIATRRR